MKMILCPPQARGCRSYSVVIARTGVQVTELRCECNYVLNTGYREQSGVGRCSGSIPRLGGRSFGWPDSGFNGARSARFHAQICGCSTPNGLRQYDRSSNL
jgi:hypothetical protein